MKNFVYQTMKKHFLLTGTVMAPTEFEKLFVNFVSTVEEKDEVIKGIMLFNQFHDSYKKGRDKNFNNLNSLPLS